MSTLNAKKIGGRLRQVRQSLGITMREMAEKLGYTQHQTIASAEAGRQNLSLKTMYQLGDMGFDLTWLITGRGSMTHKNNNKIKELVESGLVQIEQQEQLQKKKISIETKAEILGELVADGLAENEAEIDETNVVRFVKFAGSK